MAAATPRNSNYYVGPGGLVFLGASILTLMAALYTQANLLFWSFGLLVGGLITSVVFSWLMLRDLTVERLLRPHAVAGEASAVRYQVTNNKRWLPVFNLVVAESWGDGLWPWRRWTGRGPSSFLRGRPHAWIMHIGPKQSTLAEAPCWLTRRGILEFDEMEVWSTFPFGMVGRRIFFRQPAKLTVYPHLFRVRRQAFQSLMHSDPTTTRRKESVGISEEFFGLRDYRPGDRLRSIDWKRTARTGKMVARETTRPGVVRIMLMLDLTHLAPGAEKPLPQAIPTKPKVDFLGRTLPPPPEPPPNPSHPWVDAERAISLAASVICDAYFRGFPVGLVVLGAECPMFRVHRSLPHRTLILDALAQLDVSQPSKKRSESMLRATVVVTPKSAGPVAPHASHNVMNMSAGQLEDYVMEIEGGATAWLTAPDTRGRRSDREAKSWK